MINVGFSHILLCLLGINNDSLTFLKLVFPKYNPIGIGHKQPNYR